MVLLSKVKGEYQGIRFVEVLWKMCAAVVDFHLSVVSNYMMHFTGSRRSGERGRLLWRTS